MLAVIRIHKHNSLPEVGYPFIFLQLSSGFLCFALGLYSAVTLLGFPVEEWFQDLVTGQSKNLDTLEPPTDLEGKNLPAECSTIEDSPEKNKKVDWGFFCALVLLSYAAGRLLGATLRQVFLG